MKEQIETVVIGAGQAGLVMSYYLRQVGQEHVLLERHRVADRWRRERWDSLNFQFPNWSLRLPGYAYHARDPEGFANKEDVAAFIDEYAHVIGAPVRCGVEVRALRRDSESARYVLDTSHGTIEALHVVLATGPFQVPSVPAQAASLPREITQLHASHYMNPEQLRPGAVLVVGTGSSGCQIAEELYQAGRTVYLSVSLHKRAPRRYRGKDILFWLNVLGRFDTPIDSLPERKIPPPLLLTGANGGHDVDLRTFAAHGVVLLGRFRDVRDGAVAFDNDVEQRLAYADQSLVEFVRCADDYAETVGMDSADEVGSELALPLPMKEGGTSTTLDLRAANVNSIVWCTGYKYAFDWVNVPIFDAAGVPAQRRGVTRCHGVYFLGLHWMHNMRSGVLFGVEDDAAYLCRQMVPTA